ncbi:MAG: hypothetical protein ORN51_05010 [Akkermansiaceae bacterium]|nr:hypothetical protein [Akkermansiaceae bacterium]
MPAPDLRSIRTFKQLVRYLEDELGWPLDGYDIEDLTFDYEPDELGLKPADAAKIKSIRQLRPLDSKQPWGIFFIEFDKKKLPVVVLRRILSHLVVKKRASANKADRAAWHSEDLLFISAFGTEDDGREISFAHFHQEEGDMPTLRVLGWDGGDTSLKLDHLATKLREKLHWPDAKESLDHWRARWSGVFRHRVGHVINTSDMLAEAMAVLAKRIRDAAQTLIDRETDNGPLRKLHAAFKLNLIHDLTEEGFADTYAQTITYGLLTAAISRTEMSEGRKGTALVASNISDMVPVTNPFLKEMLQTFLHAGGRKGGIDFDELGVQDVVELLRGEETDLPAILRDFGNKTRGDDPVIHFYEHFLNAYNKALRIQRGVFYTPQPVVSYIVRSVHELLQTEFGLADGLADTTTWGEFIQKSKINNPLSEIKLPPLTDEPGEKRTISPDEFFVQILDPATGTATFLVEVIDVIHKHLKERWKERGTGILPVLPNPHRRDAHAPFKSFAEFWNDYVPAALLPRLHAFELMMAPYAIAHMKVGLKLAETGYRFGTEERARIYLTNALEKPDDKQAKLIGFDALAHEAAAVNEIKRHKRFTVVIGNPPYAGHSANKGDWITRLVDDYYFVDGLPLGEKNPKWLQDDYVKCIRLGQECVRQSGVGIFSFITNHGYVDNPTFRGMRQSFMKQFPRIDVLDLHGNTIKKEQTQEGGKDENVFDIKQGVAIFVARALIASDSPSRFQHGDIYGLRERKYAELVKSTFLSRPLNSVSPSSPFYLLLPQDVDLREEYNRFHAMTAALPVNVLGFQTHRDNFAVDLDMEQLEKRLTVFRATSMTDAQVKETFEISDNRDWNVRDARKQLREDRHWKSSFMLCAYRPFDARPCYFSTVTMDYPRRELLDHVAGRENVCLGLGRQGSAVQDPVWSLISVARHPVDANIFRRGGINIFPLYLYPQDAELELHSSRRPNFSTPFLKSMASVLGLQQKDPHGLPAGLTPEDIFHYAYAVLHSPGYRSRYAEFLKIDFPRLPLTGNHALFRELSRLGGELTALHLLESPKLAQPITEFIGKSKEVTRIGWSDNTVWIDAPAKKKDAAQAPGSSGFKGVPEAVWNFHIGGYQVCQKWLKDRKGRTLTNEDIAHYHKIVISLSETIRLMAEIDQVIETHGGWPGAFQTPSV